MYQKFLKDVEKVTITKIEERPEFLAGLKFPDKPMATSESLSLWGTLIAYANPMPNSRKTSGMCVGFRLGRNKYVASRVCGMYGDVSLPDIAIEWKNGALTQFCLSENAAKDWKAFLSGKLTSTSSRKENLLDIDPMEDPDRIAEVLLRYETIKGDGTADLYGEVSGIIGDTKEDIPEAFYPFLKIDGEAVLGKMVFRTFTCNIPKDYVERYAVYLGAINARTVRKDAEDILHVSQMTLDAERAVLQAQYDARIAELEQELHENPEYKRLKTAAEEAQKRFDDAVTAYKAKFAPEDDVVEEDVEPQEPVTE
jgi:hypothetical protein